MRTLLRSIAVAAVVACVSANPGKAATVQPGDTFVGPSVGAFVSFFTPAFLTDTAAFTLVGPGTFQASFSITNSFTNGIGFIGNLVLTLFAGTPANPGSELASDITPTITIGSQEVSILTNLTAGTYFLRFSGSSVTGSGTASGSISFANAAPGPTPLPGTISLFATGLGAMGLLAWRRKRRVAAAV